MTDGHTDTRMSHTHSHSDSPYNDTTTSSTVVVDMALVTLERILKLVVQVVV